MEGKGQGGNARNGELSMRSGSSRVQEGAAPEISRSPTSDAAPEISRTPASDAVPERSRTQSPGVAAVVAVPQPEVGLVDESESDSDSDREFRDGLVDENEREFRELVAQLEESIYELDDLGGYEERRRDEMNEIEQRITLVIRRWQTFIPQSRDQMDLMNLRIKQLAQISLSPGRFPPLEWLNDVGVKLLQHPRIRIAEDTVNGDNGIGNPNLLCIICQRVFEVGEIARELECGHTSHQSCLYASVTPRCPRCGTLLFKRVRQLPR